MALFVMGANVGAAVGSQIIRSNDAPTYHTGFRVCVALVSAGLAIAIGQWAWYRSGNRGRGAEGEGRRVFVE